MSMTEEDIVRVLKVHNRCAFTTYGEAVKEYQRANGLYVDGVAGKFTQQHMMTFPKKGMLSQSQMNEMFGEKGTKNLVWLALPFTMRVAWILGMTVNRIQVHRLVHDQMQAIFKEILEIYGLPAIQALGIDLYGGCYNLRKMRGSATLWSKHSWASAIDIDPARNQFHESRKTARFARPEYAAMIWIFYKHGFVSQGIEKGNDFMHFEARFLNS